MRFATTILALLLSSAVISARAEEPNTKMPPAIEVSGDATVKVAPDLAQIQFGVITKSDTARVAATENASKMDRLVQQLKKNLPRDATVKTVNYSLSPNYVYPNDGSQPRITGYTASNSVQVETSDLAGVGSLIDTATASGSNSIESLQFLLKDDSAARKDALQQSAKKAREKADALAAALGLKIVRVLHVEEGTTNVVPVQPRMMKAEAMAAAPTPVESGTLEINASVTLTVEVQ